MERILISKVDVVKHTDRISVIGLRDQPGNAFWLFQHLADENINVDIILQTVGAKDTKDISFTVDSKDYDTAMRVLAAGRGKYYEAVESSRDMTKLSIVGAGMMSHPGIAAQLFEALYNVGVKIEMIATSEIKIGVLINSRDCTAAIDAIQDMFQISEDR